MTEELKRLVKNSLYAAMDGYYPDSKMYKRIDEMYDKNEKTVVDKLINMAMKSDINYRDRYNVLSILFYLLRMHKKTNDNIDYLLEEYRKIILSIFKHNEYSKNRKSIDDFVDEGFTNKEALSLFVKNIDNETDIKNIKRYKFAILCRELINEFPNQKFFHTTTRYLELNGDEDAIVKNMQEFVDEIINRYGEEVVRCYLKMFLNHRYAKNNSKKVLKQMKINGDDSWLM